MDVHAPAGIGSAGGLPLCPYTIPHTKEQRPQPETAMGNAMTVTPTPIREMTFGWYIIYDKPMTGREKHPYVIANQPIIIEEEKWYPAFQVSSESHQPYLIVNSEIPPKAQVLGTTGSSFIRFDYNYLVHKKFFDKNGVCIYIQSVSDSLNTSIFQRIPSLLPFLNSRTTYLYLTLDGKFEFKLCTANTTPPAIPTPIQQSLINDSDFMSIKEAIKRGML